MANKLTTIPEAKIIYKLLNPKPDLTRFVGGCVRDIILNHKISDIDLATILEPREVIKRLETEKLNLQQMQLNLG